MPNKKAFLVPVVEVVRHNVVFLNACLKLRGDISYLVYSTA